MRKAVFTLLAAFLCVPALAATARAQTPDEVIEKHLAAIGGRAALAKLTSRRATGTITIATAQGDISGPVEIDVKIPNKSRVSMELDLSAMGVPDKMAIEQKFDGTAGWALNSMQGDSEITGNQLENMRNNLFPTSLLTYKTTGFKMEALPKETINGKALIVLRATPKTGSSTKLYFDPDSYLLVQTVATISSPQMGDVEQTSQFSDFRVVDGLKMPFQIVNSNPAQTGTIKLTKVEHNVPLADSLFSAKGPTPLGAGK